MNLKDITEKLLADSMKTPIRGLSAISEAEKYLKQAYEGRYFFELIQNVRDANKEKNQDGEIFIELKDNILSIANTGAEFSPEGIDGITTIGQSTKQSQDYIGFKGIGFKSIQEISDEPKIVTHYGSVYFDRKLTIEKYNGQNLKEEQIPLFYFPHFNNRKLSNSSETEKNIVTKIELLIKKNITEDKIIHAFSEIQAKQLVLLGNIKQLRFESQNKTTEITIKKNLQKSLIEVDETDKPGVKFKYFTPSSRVVIPESVIQSLEDKEKDIFSKSSYVDINIVMELADNGQIKPIDDAKLYLFYPLEISSGFRFIIHSYFIVNPERTALRDSHLNNYLLNSIGAFIGIEMLRRLKQTKINTNKILCFKRNKDAKINILYDCVVAELKKQRFVYDSQTQKYFKATEVIVADGFEKGLFPNGKLGGKQLIYTDDKEIINWLREEFDIPYLSFEKIANQIENECKQQAKEKKLNFFQKLYDFVNQHEELNLSGKKVLITDDWKLVSSDEDVFYGGDRKNINLKASIRKHIHFIHKNIKFKKTDFREGKSRTGIIEYNTYELVKRLLKLFDKASVPNGDVLNAIFNLHPLDTKSEIEIKEKVLLPIKGKGKWLSPLTNPIYFEIEDLKELYPDGNYIDENVLKWLSKESNTISSGEFLKNCGVWEIPAIFITEKPIRLPVSDKRNKTIKTISGLVTQPYIIRYDRVLDLPAKYNYWFANSIIENWNHYKSFITSKLLPTLQYSNISPGTNTRYATESFAIIKLSNFIETLSTEKWIVFSGENETYSVDEVIGIKSLDFVQSHNKVISRYLKLLPINYEQKRDLIDSIGLVHLDGSSVQNFSNLLDLIHKKYESNIPEGKDFIDFYNRILSKLVDFFYNNYQTVEITQLKNKFFLSINDISKRALWTKAIQIFYIDNKPNYDMLPLSIKEKVQPHFTNRDKNTFGKIAAKIGKKFSNSIHKELIQTEAIKSYTLLSFFEYLPESIAILESKFETVLTEYFNTIKVIRVFENENLNVKISVDHLEKLEVSVDHFVDVDNNYNFHFSCANQPNKNRQIAESVSELFINLLGRDLRSYNIDLLRFLNSVDKKEYLRDYDIIKERINEIREKLYSYDLTINQKFWEAILTAKKINKRENIFIDKKIDIYKLSESLNIEKELIQKIQDKLNFNQISASENITLLADLLKSLNINLEEVNKNIFPKIDFRDFYENKLTNLKNKFEKGFDSLLHTHLSNQSSDEKCLYQDHLDNYKRYFQFSIPLNTLELIIEEFFLDSLAERFSFLKITRTELQKDFSFFNSVSIYSENLTLFQSKLKGEEYTNENLDTFLVDNKKRSLLYFNEIDLLAERFKVWLADFKVRNKPTDEESDLENFLSEFSNQTETYIEEVSIHEVEVPVSKVTASGEGSGKRFDGAANDQFKKRLGLVAEMVVYEKLKSIYNNVIWVSKYASKIYKTHQGYNPEGQDGLGYDIEYFDSDGNKIFVEVKGRADNYDIFEISKNEIDKAHKAKQYYKIFFVTQTLNNSQRRIRDLGNIFMLEDGQDFFSNTKFKAIYKSFEIRFQEN